jgi:hypothetical protein
LVARDPITPDQTETVLAFAREHQLPVMRFSIEINEISRPLNSVAPSKAGAVALLDVLAQEKVVA